MKTLLLSAALALSTITSPNTSLEQEVFTATNQVRIEAGLQPVQPNEELTTLAQDWSQTMLEQNRLYHRPDLREHSTNEYLVSENVLYSMGRQVDGEDLVDQWMNSPGHRANILNPNNKYLGVGVAEGDRNTIYATQNFGVSY